MRITTYHIRGLGGRIKKSAIKGLIAKEKLDLICIQETNLETTNQNL